MHKDYGVTWRGRGAWVTFYPETYRCKAHYQAYVETCGTNKRLGVEAIGYPTQAAAIDAIENRGRGPGKDRGR